MWSRFGKALGLFGSAAPETEPFVPPETSTDASPPPRAPSPTYSPPPSPDRNVVPPDAPELRPCPPTIQWMAKITAMQTSGMEYDNAIFANNIVGYHRAPRWLANFVARWLSTYVPTIKHDLPRPPDAPKRFHYEWCQRALKALYEAGQMLEVTYHFALIELMSLGHDVVDDPDIAAICNAEAESYDQRRAANSWGSANATAWGRGADTRDTGPAVVNTIPWAPHPGHPPARGQPVSMVVAEGIIPGWGSARTRSPVGAQEAIVTRSHNEEYARREAREKASYKRERDAARRSRNGNSSKWSQSNDWAQSHAPQNPSALNPRAQTPQSRSGGKRKHDEDSDDDRSSIRSQSSSRHKPQRSSQRDQSDHSNQGGKGKQPARGRGRIERAEAYFTEQGSISDATDSQASRPSRWYNSDQPKSRPPHPPPKHPASFSQTEMAAREALYRDRAQAEADWYTEEAAREERAWRAEETRQQAERLARQTEQREKLCRSRGHASCSEEDYAKQKAKQEEDCKKKGFESCATKQKYTEYAVSLFFGLVVVVGCWGQVNAGEREHRELLARLQQ